MDDLDNALKNHQDALETHREKGDRRGEASALANIGLIYRDKGDTDKALKYLQEALEVFREAAPQSVSIVLTDIALIHLKDENPEKGFEFLARALSTSQATEQFNEAFRVMLATLTAMVSDNDWAELAKIDVMYRSGIIKDNSFIDFFTCIHELAMFHETDDMKHKKAYKSAWQKLDPRLREILAKLLEEEEEREKK